jgi:hypothetical protein
MIVTEFYNGQGLGNQLWCYIVLRCLCEDKNYDFGIMTPEKFKGKEFMDIDMGNKVIGGSGPEGGPPIELPHGITGYFREKSIDHPVAKILISKMDMSLYSIPDNTKIDGNFQSINYIENYRKKIKEWIKIRDDKNLKEFSFENICIIHIRGGDFLGSLAYLTSEYYKNAIEIFKKENPNMVFYIITDDPSYANSILPEIKIIGGSSSGKSDNEKAGHHMGGPVWMDWSILYNCKNAIISASSFSWWPIWLNDNANVIAPMYWADYKRSDGYWSCGDSLISGWRYLNREGKIYEYDECKRLKDEYEFKNRNLYGY